MKPYKENFTTVVSPSIMRQIPQYSVLKSMKRLKASVSIDYLSLNVTSINETFIRDLATKKYSTRNKAFSKVEGFDYQGFEFSISSEGQFNLGSQNPQHKSPTKTFEYQITLNPSYFPSGTDVKNLLDLISSDISCGNHQVSRLDVSFAMPQEVFSPLLVSTMCHFKWKRTSTDYRQEKKSGKISGIHYPSKSISMSIYLHDLVKRSSYLKKYYVREKNMTIFEMQLKKSFLEKEGLVKVSDLENFEWKCAFKKYAFYDLVTFKQEAKSISGRLTEFQDDVRTMGFQHARIQYNKEHHRNFNREIGIFLSPLKINKGKASLVNCLHRRFKEYLAEWNPWDSSRLLNNNNRNFIPQSFGEIPFDQPSSN